MRHHEPIRRALTSIFVRGLSYERNDEEEFFIFFFISDLFGGIWSEVLQFFCTESNLAILILIG